MGKVADRISSQPAMPLTFTRTLSLNISGDWVCLHDVQQAQACLESRFPDNTAPSFSRAVAMCETALQGKISSDAAQAALLVAAMEAEFAFEFLEDDALALERKVEAEAEKGLREFLFAEMAA